MSEKIQKVLATHGFGSRRQIERQIREGRIFVNGCAATIGDRIQGNEVISRDSKTLTINHDDQTTRVICYHKPQGFVCSHTDFEDRPTVYQQLPKIKQGRWVMVGRLDINTSGLLLFSNNGKLAHYLMHPSSNIEREYAVRILGKVSPRAIDKLLNGVMLEDGMANFTAIKEGAGQGANRWYQVTLTEGRNREVRRLWASQELMVSRLIRIRYGNIHLNKNLTAGHHQELAPHQVAQLLTQCDKS